MTNYRFYVLTAVFCTVIVFGQADVTTKSPSTISIPPQEPESPVVNLDKKIDSTLPDSDLTTTTPESTPKPTTTTSSTTSTSTTTKSTSTMSTTTPAPPTTTTVAPITTTSAPGPVPQPKANTWKFSENGSNVSCIMVHFAAQLDITYTETVNNSAKLKHIILNVPDTANVTDGSCGNETQWLTIGWPVADDATVNNTLTLLYKVNSTTKSYALKQLNVTLAKEVFPDSNSSVVLFHGAEWETPLATSYRCEPATRLPMSAEETGAAANLTISQLQEEAFRVAPGSGFSAGRECGGNDVPDAVPIAVGCALGGLVLVVLVAYLVARRRSAARGYLSM